MTDVEDKEYNAETMGDLVLINLIHNNEFFENTIPYIKAEYFEQEGQKIIMKHILNFYEKYDASPTEQTLKIDIDNAIGINETYKEEIDLFFNTVKYEKIDYKWLYDNSELFCQRRALYNAINKAYFIFDGTEESMREHEIPEMMEEALGTCFDDNIGYTYIDDYEQQYEHYHDQTERMSFDIEGLNEITRGGIERKTLTILASGVNKGKTTFMCQFAAHSIKQGRNVLYISMEMGDEWVAEKLDTNLLDMSSEEIIALSREEYEDKINQLKKKVKGKLIIKQYPSSGIHVGHFKVLLKDLRRKKDFVPDIIIIDYINNCVPMRGFFKSGGTYEHIKIVAEEVRSLAITENVAIVSPTQLNREGAQKKDPDMTNVAESWGIPQTCDRLWIMQMDDEMEIARVARIIQTKKRDGSKVKDRPIELFFNSDKSRFEETIIEMENVEEQAYQIYKKEKRAKAEAGIDVMPDKMREAKAVMGNKGKEKFAKFN